MTHDEAIQKVMPLGKKSKANKKGFSAHLSFYEVLAGNGRERESPDAIFFRNDGETIVVEVKVDRTDFLRDKKKAFRQNPSLGMGTHRYYACPIGLIEPHDLPDGWGLIWIPTDGSSAYIKIWSAEFEANYLAERNLLFSLLRRCNNYLPVARWVEYDKIVTRCDNAIMKHGSNHSKTRLLQEVRKVFWDKLVRAAKYSRK